jgi:hypothetical protein
VVDYADAAPEVEARLRLACAGLPDAYEEHPGVGVRWRVRKRTFVQLFTVDSGGEGAGDLVTGITFHSSGDELAALRRAGHPFFRPGWGRDMVGMIIDDGVDWEEVAELVTESYCIVAPKKLVAQVDRPEDPEADAPP